MNPFQKLSATETKNVNGGFFPLLGIAIATYKQLKVASDPEKAREYIEENSKSLNEITDAMVPPHE